MVLCDRVTKITDQNFARPMTAPNLICVFLQIATQIEIFLWPRFGSVNFYLSFE